MASQRSSLLSPLDQFMPRTYTRIFIVFELEDQDAAIESLRKGLRKTCSQVPYLTGHVYSSPQDNNRLGISWSSNDMTPEIHEIQLLEQPLSYSTLKREGAPLQYFRNQLSPVSVRPDHSTPESKAPVFAASYSRIDGGLILTVCVHHNVMDGTGVGQLIRLWADNTISPTIRLNPNVDPDEPISRLSNLLGVKASTKEDSNSRTWEELMQRHPEFTLLSSQSTTPGTITTAPKLPKSTSKIHRLSGAKINAARDLLRPLANAEILTMNNIISAIVWSTVSRIRFTRLGSSAPPTSKLGFAVNGRKHLGNEFVERVYLGNVNLFGLANLPSSDLERASKCFCSVKDGSFSMENAESILPVLYTISTAISRVSPSYITEVIALEQRLPDVADLMPGWNAMNGPDLTMTSWANLGIYDCDFGASVGKPAFVRVPFVEYDGLVIILPRRRVPSNAIELQGNGGRQDDEVIEIVIMLRSDDMEALDKDMAWRSWSC